MISLLLTLSRLGLISLLLMTLPCHASDWRMVGGLPDEGVTVQIDDASLVIEHDTIVKGWVRFDYMAPRQREGQMVTGYSSYRTINCNTQRYWVSEGWAYLPDSPDLVPLYFSSQEWKIAPPDSEAEIAVVALCYETKSLFGIVWEKLDLKNNLVVLWEKMRKGISKVNDYDGQTEQGVTQSNAGAQPSAQ